MATTASTAAVAATYSKAEQATMDSGVAEDVTPLREVEGTTFSVGEEATTMAMEVPETTRV